MQERAAEARSANPPRMTRNADPDRPTGTERTNRPKDTGCGHGGARRGFAGKLESAKSTAPAGATQGDIQDVAWVAWDTGRDPADVWPEVDADG